MSKKKINKKKSKNKDSKSFSWRDVCFWLLWIGIIGYALIEGTRQTYHNYQLKKNGKQMSAYITGSHSKGNKGTAYDYKFTVDGQYYEGELYYGQAEEGDSIIVIYLPKDPNINRAKMDLK